MSAFEIAGFVLAGALAGAYGTLVGVGGGLFIVPLLVLDHFAPKEAAGTSMVVVFANAVSGSIAFLRRGVVDVRTAITFGVLGLPGVAIGAYADQLIPRATLGLLFGIFLMLMAVRLLWNPGAAADNHAAVQAPSRARRWLSWSLAFCAGFVASMFGIGGGIIYVPTMAYVLRFPVHIATASSTLAIALTALFGIASHGYYHDIHYGPALALASGAIGGAQIGAAFAPRVRSAPLLRLFAAAVLLSGAWLIGRAIVHRI